MKIAVTGKGGVGKTTIVATQPDYMQQTALREEKINMELNQIEIMADKLLKK